MNKYLKEIYENLKTKYYYEQEYLNTVSQFLESISNYLDENPRLMEKGIIERLVEPDRIITFKVPWVDDNGKVRVNSGYRVQHSNLLGVYKGGLRFTPLVNPSILKFLAFEQTFKNALTGLPLGGGKGGSDFNPKGRSDLEIMRFSQSFMNELYKYIGIDEDVPASDVGVGPKELGYLYGQYKKITNKHFALTSKGVSFGGSLLRPEATGYGACYIGEQALNLYFSDSFKNKTVIVSGTGQVAINAAFKATELGGLVIGMSNSKNAIYNEDGIDIELVQSIKANNESLAKYLDKYPNTKLYDKPSGLWQVKADIAIPSATQDEITEADAKALIANGLRMLVEGANKPSTAKAIEIFKKNKVLFIPSKVANAGGVSVSALEMQQNVTTSTWTKEEVDSKLKDIMANLFTNVYNMAKELGDLYNLERAANIVAFRRLSDAMMAQGV